MRSRIVVGSLGTAAWRGGLADPDLHWRRGKSAWELAVSWESVRKTDSGLPAQVHAAIDTHPDLRDPELLVGIPEHKVVLDTARTPSQNDLWCMIRTRSGQVSVAVEGKAGEDFDRRLEDWLGSSENRKGKEARLAFLKETLGITGELPLSLRYQLLHRTASAVLEARRWRAQRALMIVQSFRESSTSWQDFADFCELRGLNAIRNGVWAGQCEWDCALPRLGGLRSCGRRGRRRCSLKNEIARQRHQCTSIESVGACA